MAKSYMENKIYIEVLHVFNRIKTVNLIHVFYSCSPTPTDDRECEEV